LNSEQPQKRETLTFRYEVRAIQQRVGQPGKQLDDRSAGIAEARIGPLGRVRRYSSQHLVYEIVKTAIV
jgi:hypothetical protein